MNLRIIASFVIYQIFIINGEETSYTNEFDGLDLHEILTNDRLLTAYVNCLLEKGPCTPDGKELKKNLPDAIDNGCKKCTQKQREGADEVMHYIIDNRPEDWTKLEDKYQSDGSYKRKYLASKQVMGEPEDNNSTQNTAI
uniref:Chemosensory protein 12 n=1 Tax=Dendrolimus punctatus TaxID=238572 RepID=A0A2K8GKZ3_9NEOP|nr:Chemosensory protein 12 [Dendrolimus punctatus]